MRHRLGLIILLSSILLFSGCIYYNTFFWARKNFNQAESKQQENLRAKEDQQSKSNAPPVNTQLQQNPGGTVEVSAEVRNLYQNAIDKANKVLANHPNSKWVPDALWLIGKSYYSMGDYILADLKFKELVTNHPDSKYAERSYYYMGLCQMNLEHEDQALSAFAMLENAPKKSDYLEDVIYAKGLMEMKGENYSDAADLFSQYIQKYSGDSSDVAMYNIGKCKEQLKDYWGAYTAYKTVPKYHPSKHLYFEATLASATMALASDSLALGMNILQALGKDQTYFAQAGEINLRTADGYYLQNETDKAVKLYQQVTTENPKTRESAEAFYRLGIIFQDDKFDLTSAKDNFTKAQNEASDSEFRPLAMARSAQIAKLETFQQTLHRVDSLKAWDELNSMVEPDPVPNKIVQQSVPNDSMIGPQPNDSSLHPSPDTSASPAIAPKESSLVEQPLLIGPKQESAGISQTLAQSSIPKPDSFIGPINSIISNKAPKEAYIPIDAKDDSIHQAIMNSGIETRFLLSELYAYELNRPDSALQEYLLIVSEYPTSSYAPRALLAAAQIELQTSDSTNAREHLQQLLKDYPESPQAAHAAEILEQPISAEDNAMSLYAAAESLAYDANMPDSAVALFTYIAGKFPDLAAQSKYAVAWILDQIKGVEDSSAYYAYAEVAKNYPQTEFGIAAKARLTFTPHVDTGPKTTTRDQKAAQDTTAPADSADTTSQLVQGLQPAPPVITAPDFIYPEALLTRDLRGKVTFKIRLENSGKVKDYEIIGPSGEYAIDSSATATLMGTEFDVSKLSFVQLEDYFQYTIRFIRPKITNFYNPYLQRQEQGP
jgi:TonB family protein